MLTCGTSPVIDRRYCTGSIMFVFHNCFFDVHSSTLTPMHLRKAKLMFFWVRYPSSAILKMYFPDIKFNKNNTAQLVKWFSNFRYVRKPSTPYSLYPRVPPLPFAICPSAERRSKTAKSQSRQRRACTDSGLKTVTGLLKRWRNSVK